MDEMKSAKIEVTPEMVEAGFRVLKTSCIADDYLDADKLTLVEIYRAMAAAGPLANSEGKP